MIKSTGAESLWRLLPFHICSLSSTVSAGEAALIIKSMTTVKGKGLSPRKRCIKEDISMGPEKETESTR